MRLHKRLGFLGGTTSVVERNQNHRTFHLQTAAHRGDKLHLLPACLYPGQLTVRPTRCLQRLPRHADGDLSNGDAD